MNTTLTTKDKVNLGVSVLAILLIVPFAILDAYVFTRLWAWFIAGPFHLPLINKAQAYGIVVMLIFATKHLATRVFDTKRDNAAVLCLAEIFALTLGTWGIGAFMHWVLF